MKRFLIDQKGVYYLTTGKLLRYDSAEARNENEKQGVEQVKREFERIRDQPHTWYQAVEVEDSSFSPGNTGE